MGPPNPPVVPPQSTIVVSHTQPAPLKPAVTPSPTVATTTKTPITTPSPAPLSPHDAQHRSQAVPPTKEGESFDGEKGGKDDVPEDDGDDAAAQDNKNGTSKDNSDFNNDEGEGGDDESAGANEAQEEDTIREDGVPKESQEEHSGKATSAMNKSAPTSRAEPSTTKSGNTSQAVPTSRAESSKGSSHEPLTPDSSTATVTPNSPEMTHRENPTSAPSSHAVDQPSNPLSSAATDHENGGDVLTGSSP